MASQIVYLPLNVLKRISGQRALDRQLGLQHLGAVIEKDASSPFTMRIVADSAIHCRDAWPALLGDAFVLLLSSVDVSQTHFRPVPLSEATTVGLLEVAREALLKLDLSAHEKMEVARTFQRALVSAPIASDANSRPSDVDSTRPAAREAIAIQDRLSAKLRWLDTKLARYQAVVSTRGLDYLVARLACHADFGQVLHLRPHPHYRGLTEAYPIAEPTRGTFARQRLASENLANVFHDAIQRVGPYSAQASIPIDLVFLKQLHADLMRGIDGRALSGQWREHPMLVHSPVSGRVSAGEVAPQDLPAAMQEFETRYLSGEWEAVHPIIHSALVHLELARVHPFRDGNGRLGRMLLQLLLARRQMPLLPWELTLLRQRPAYLAAIEEAISTENPMPFVRFLVDAAGLSVELGFEMAAALRRERRSVIKSLVDVHEAPWHAQPLAEWALVHALTDGGPQPYDHELRLPKDREIDGLDVVYFEGGRCRSAAVARRLLRQP